jgi:hypothetical protein
MDDDEKKIGQVVECCRVEDYTIDDCELCDAPVLRPLCAPPGAEAICSHCHPVLMEMATAQGAKVVERMMITADGQFRPPSGRSPAAP